MAKPASEAEAASDEVDSAAATAADMEDESEERMEDPVKPAVEPDKGL